ncbi:MAG: hypothetical protein HY975_04460 [Candidatus Kerfeldbacteria bacterium]|nr:hypothetical protein [Candidatus Kerfeldbacteria bacterium]
MTPPTPESILQAIKEKHVTMTPRWHFIVRVSLAALLGIFIALTLFFLTSLMEFFWTRTHLNVLPGFGGRGIALLALRFPWWYFVALVIGMASLIWLLRRFSLGYRLPLVVLAGGSLAVLVAVSLVLVRTDVHQRLENRASRHQLPLVGGLYRGIPGRIGEIHLGTISNLTKKGFTMIVVDDRQDVSITVTEETEVPPGWVPTVGERVAVLSARDGKNVTAISIRPFWGGPRDGFTETHYYPPVNIQLE